MTNKNQQMLVEKDIDSDGTVRYILMKISDEEVVADLKTRLEAMAANAPLLRDFHLEYLVFNMSDINMSAQEVLELPKSQFVKLVESLLYVNEI